MDYHMSPLWKQHGNQALSLCHAGREMRPAQSVLLYRLQGEAIGHTAHLDGCRQLQASASRHQVAQS